MKKIIRLFKRAYNKLLRKRTGRVTPITKGDISAKGRFLYTQHHSIGLEAPNAERSRSLSK